MVGAKRKIASDVDEVLFDLLTPLNVYYNKRFGANLTFENYEYYDLERVWGCTKQEATQIISDFYKSEEFKAILPVRGAQQAVRLLSPENDFSAVTSRPLFIQVDTSESISKYFGNAFSEIFYNGQYGVLSSGLDKSGYCLERGIPILLEDNLDIARKSAERGIVVILFDRLWNKAPSLPRGIIRVGEAGNHWQEAVEQLS